MTNFISRSITGAVFVIILISAILINPLTFIILIGFTTFTGLNEFYSIVNSGNIKPYKYSGICCGMVLFISSCLYAAGYSDSSAFLFLIPFIPYFFLCEIYQKNELPFVNIAMTLTGIIYIAIPFSLLVLSGFPLHTLTSYKPHLILGLFILFWTADTGAYLFGITFGKHPLFPRISPKKTWEGLLGGIALTITIAILLSNYFTELQIKNWMVIALIICIFGVLGDLTESMLKRSYNIKDSGNILPGHGGILDRFDAVIFAIPIVFIYLQLVFR